jgi:hypothetical protein
MKKEELPEQENWKEETTESIEPVGRGEEGRDGKGYIEFSQSRSAIFIALSIILLLDLIGIIVTLTEASSDATFFSSPFTLVGSIILDIFLGVKILQGKNWARMWMLIRIVAGMVIFGGIALIQGNFGELTITTGLSLTLILLLTGTSTRLRIAGSIVLGALAILGGIILTFTMDFMTDLPTVPETSTPDYFSTYTSEGFFSISYPPDWDPIMSIIEEAEVDMKQWLKSEGFESQADEMQLVFGAAKLAVDEDYPIVTIMVAPQGLWPLGTIVEADTQWAREIVEQYVEHSIVKTTIGGREAIIVISQGVMPDFSLSPQRVTTAYIAGSEFIWVVVGMCDIQDSDAYLDTFDDIVRSLRVEY